MSTTNGVNDTRLKDAIAETRELARTQAAGERSLAVFAGKLIQWAVDGVIDTTKDKHGKGIDDASLFYDNWTEAHSKKLADAHSVGGKKANKSKMRQCIAVGGMTIPGSDPITEFDRQIALRAEAAKADPKSVKPEYHAIVDWARAQKDCEDRALTDDEIKAAVLKPEKGEQDLLDVVEGMYNKLEKLISGEAGFDRAKTQVPALTGAADLLREFVATLVLEKKQDEVRAKALELGWVVNESGQLEMAA